MWREARLSANYKQEAAARDLHIGTRTLYEYEIGETTLPPDVALGMSRIYNRPELTTEYCRQYCPIGAVYCNDPVKQDLSVATLGFLKEFKDVLRLKDSLIDVLSDGVVDSDEVEVLKGHLKELLELERAIETIKLAVAPMIPLEQMISDLNQERKKNTRRHAMCSA